MAARPVVRRNGKILTTALTSPELFQVDDNGREPVKVVHTFANATSVTGICSVTYARGKDVFYVIAGTMIFGSYTPVPGSWSVYEVNLRHRQPRVSFVANFPDSIMLNGIRMLNKHKRWFLVSDAGAGIVYRLEAKTGTVVKVLENPHMKPNSPPSSGIGINGIQISTMDGHLYFTNTDRNFLARIPIQSDGTPKGSAILNGPFQNPTGLALDGNAVFIAQNGNDSLIRVTSNTKYPLTLKATESQLFGPTAMGPIDWDGKVGLGNVFVSTNGGTTQYLEGNVTRGGTISRVGIKWP